MWYPLSAACWEITLDFSSRSEAHTHIHRRRKNNTDATRQIVFKDANCIPFTANVFVFLFRFYYRMISLFHEACKNQDLVFNRGNKWTNQWIPLTALDVGTSQLSCWPKVDADELSLKEHINIILTDLLIEPLSSHGH